MFYCRHAILHIQVVFVCFSSSIKSGLLDVVAFRKSNLKSYTSVAWEFSKTCPLFHISWYHFTFVLNRFCSFAQAAIIITSTLLFLATYSLLGNILHPAKRCCTVSRCPLHNLHWLFSVSFYFQTFLQALVSSSVLSLT